MKTKSILFLSLMACAVGCGDDRGQDRSPAESSESSESSLDGCEYGDCGDYGGGAGDVCPGGHDQCYQQCERADRECTVECAKQPDPFWQGECKYDCTMSFFECTRSRCGCKW